MLQKNRGALAWALAAGFCGGAAVFAQEAEWQDPGVWPSESAPLAASAQNQQALDEDLEVSLPPPSGEPLSIDEAARMALAKNLDIEVLRLQNAQTAQQLRESRSLYDLGLNVEGAYQIDETEPAIGIFGARSVSGSIVTQLTQHLPTGTDLTLRHRAARESTQSSFAALSRYYESSGELAITQPVLENAFGVIDRSRLKQVRLAVERFDYATQDAVEAQVHRIRSAYWDLVYAGLNLRAKERALQQAQAFLRTTRSKLDLGLVEAQDLYGAEANVRRRVLDAHQAYNGMRSQQEVLAVLLDLPEGIEVLPSTEPVFEAVEVDVDESLRRAFANRRDFKALKLEAEQSNLQLVEARSGAWPRLDLEASYRSNGLDRELWSSQGEIGGFNHPTLFAGFSFDMPVQNRAARAGVERARLEKRRILALLKQTERVIGQEVRNAARDVRLAEESVRQTEQIETLQRKKLEAEEKNFQLGRSDSRTVIDFQEDLIVAEQEAQRALVAYQQAVEALLRRENTLLERGDLVAEE